MTKIIESFAGDTKEVERLRGEIKSALETGPVKVHLWQPGIMYEKGDEFFTVIDFINEWQGQPVSFYSNLVPLKKVECDFHYTNDMFISGNKLYKSNVLCSDILKSLDPIKPNRKYYWDFLFGHKRRLKDQFYKTLLNHKIETKVLHTYFESDTKKGIWSHGHAPNKHTAETLSDKGVRISDLIDVEIYNQTYYSAVIETAIHNDFAMFSEKEAKPIMAKRPFVIMGSRHQLKAFRSLGFKTFDQILDESYDEIEDVHERFFAIIETMEKLTELDPIEVYRVLNPILEHNYKHFLEFEWTRV